MYAFRVDSSREIGSGHLMRCLSLADRLGSDGYRCVFLCRPAPGDLIDEIERHGHTVIGIDSTADDAGVTCEALSGFAVDWVILDHYGLGLEWERAVGRRMRNLLAIDDIGREHECSLLLDQNFSNPMHDRYRKTMPQGRLLLGPQYALLRREFAACRPAALQRRTGKLSRILVSMGGSDPGNATATALAGLESAWRDGWQADVIIGAGNPHRELIQSICSRLPAAALHIQTSSVAQLMTAADCAIGAGGSTTWERCCLGLPSLVSIISSDQAAIATAVARAGAQALVGRGENATTGDFAQEIAVLSPARMLAMSASAASLCDGLGADRVAERLKGAVGNE